MKKITLCLLVFAAVWAANCAHALIVYGETNAEALVSYSSATDAETSVVKVGGCSAVYLGNGWFLTANHVGVSLNGALTQNGTSATVSYIDTTLNTTYGVDLKLFYVENVANLASLTSVSLSSSVCGSVTGQTTSRGHTINGTSIELVTSGWGRADDSSVSSSTAAIGTSSTSGIRSTDTYVDAVAAVSGFDYFIAISNAAAGEAALVTGDSGGGMFVNVGGVYYLVGTAVSANNSASGSDNVVAFGTTTSDSSYSFFLDLSNYADDINEIISTNPLSSVPEPAEYAAVSALAALALVFLRRRK